MPITLSVQLARAEIERVATVKYLGMFIDDDMKWNTHINKLYTVLCRNVGIINRLKYFLSANHLLLLYNSLFLSHVNYCCFIFCNTYSSHLSKIEKLQERVVRLVDGQTRLAHSAPIFKKLKILKIKRYCKPTNAIIAAHKITKQLTASN